MDANKLFGFEGKTVVVSGAYSGMGLAAAKLLVELGANIYTICRANGRHSQLDFPVAGEFRADFGVKEDIDRLAEELPDRIDALFLCHGIALNSDGSNTLDVQKVNFLGHKYFLEKAIHKVVDSGSVSIIGSAGGFDWETIFEDCMAVIQAPTYEDALAWYEAHPDVIASGYVFSKQCLNTYVRSMVHDPMYIDRTIRLNLIAPGHTSTGLKEDFAVGTSPSGNAAEGMEIIESLFLEPWDGYWAEPEQMGWPLVAIGSKLFDYMSGQIIYIDYGVSATWQIDSME